MHSYCKIIVITALFRQAIVLDCYKNNEVNTGVCTVKPSQCLYCVFKTIYSQHIREVFLNKHLSNESAISIVANLMRSKPIFFYKIAEN